jgi:hypothetical protein
VRGAMNEEQWLESNDPKAMLAFLWDSAMASDRKLRLFAAASFRQLAFLLPDDRQHLGIEMLERLPEGPPSLQAWRRVTEGVRLAVPRRRDAAEESSTDAHHYLGLLLHGELLYRELRSTAVEVHAVQVFTAPAHAALKVEQARLLRDMIANPFRPPPWIDPASLTWNDGLIPKLAEAAYENRSLPSGELDKERLSVLADALEEVGAEGSMLEHLRGPGPFVRGDWVVDLLTGRM